MKWQSSVSIVVLSLLSATAAHAAYQDPAGGADSAITVSNIAPVEIQDRPTDRAFTPNGDGVDDTLALRFTLNESAYVTMLVKDHSGRVVRRLMQETTAGTTAEAVWDGTNDSGTMVPDGAYTINLTARDRHAFRDSAHSQTAVLSGSPGYIEAPDDIDGLFETADFTYIPGADFGMSRVRVYTSFFAALGNTTIEHPDGSWIVPVATKKVSDGVHQVFARVYWIDQFGIHHRNHTDSISILIDNESRIPVTITRSPRAQAFTPNGDDRDESLTLNYAISEPANIRLEILDSSGTIVASLLEEFSTRRSIRSSWAGLTDDGAPADQGLYRARFTATDSDGFVAVSETETEIVRDLPGTVAFPLDGDVVSGRRNFEFVPAGERAVTSVRFYTEPQRSLAFTTNADPDGAWRTAVNASVRPEAEVGVFARVHWKDRFGITHLVHTPTTTMIIDHTPPSADVIVEPESDRAAPTNDVVVVTVDDPKGRDIEVVVDFGDGTEPQMGTVSAPYAPLRLPHTYEDVGLFALSVTATKEGGNQADAAATAKTDEPPPPFAVLPDKSTTLEDTPAAIAVTDNDGAPGHIVDLASLRLLSQPAHGSAEVAPGGILLFAPAPNTSGIMLVEYEVCSTSGPCLSTTASIDVLAVNDVPACVSGVLMMNESTKAAAMAGCTDADDDSLTIRLISVPDELTIAVEGGLLRVEASTPGVFSLTYQSSDGQADSELAVLRVTVIAKPVPPAPTPAPTPTPGSTTTVPPATGPATTSPPTVAPATTSPSSTPSSPVPPTATTTPTSAPTTATPTTATPPSSTPPSSTPPSSTPPTTSRTEPTSQCGSSPPISIEFDIGSGLTNSTSGSVSAVRPVALGCTTYQLVLVTMDADHEVGYQTSQTHERWFVEGLDANGAVIFASSTTPDLAEGQTVQRISLGNVDLSNVVSFRARHARIGYSINSIHLARAVLTSVS